MILLKNFTHRPSTSSEEISWAAQPISVSSVTKHLWDLSWNMHHQYGTTVSDATSIKSNRFSAMLHISPQLSWQTSSVTAMLQKLQWDSLQQWRARSRVLMLYRIRNGLIAIPAAAYLAPVPICTRRFETRYVQIQWYSQTFFPSAVRLWNTMPVDVCQLSPDSFKTHLNSFCFIWALEYVQFLSSALHCTVFIGGYCSLFAARLSRYTSAYSLMVRYCSELSRHRYRKMR